MAGDGAAQGPEGLGDISDRSVEEVSRMLAGVRLEPGGSLWSTLEQDGRKGVQRLLARAIRNRRAAARELERIRSMRRFEERLWHEGLPAVAGIDEAGRGPLAGPVVAAAVVLPRDREIPGIDDSKKLSPAKREELCAIIRREAVAVSVGRASENVIDEVNILNATHRAMRDAVNGLSRVPDHVLVDGGPIPELAVPQTAIVRGDELSTVIAAASIIAKVSRDREMVELDREYPGYGFAKHKGYGTPDHIAALARLGPCEIHRRSFRVVRDAAGGYSARYLEFRAELLGATSESALVAVAGRIRAAKEDIAGYELSRLRGLYKRCHRRIAAGVLTGRR